jgi:ectoine hydroxylase-related dioxygenase (phytanoyl-CoA dioxygenase family)
MQDEATLLSEEQVGQFNKDGLLIVRNFYDLEKDILPIQHAIYNLLEILIRKYNLPIIQKPFSSADFDSGYQELIAHDRKIGGEVYDAVKQIPAFFRLCAHLKNDLVLRQLRGTDMPGIAAGGYGIRINNPGEERFRAEWHQEYPSQLRSMDGIVLWSPLVNVTKELGPVQFCLGSHSEGPVPVYTKDPLNPDKKGAYGLILKGKDELLSKYPVSAPLTAPGDVVLVDFMTLHASGHNVSKRSLWSMQLRYFNFREPTGIRNSWCGSYAAGVDFTKIHPELVAD